MAFTFGLQRLGAISTLLRGRGDTIERPAIGDEDGALVISSRPLLLAAGNLSTESRSDGARVLAPIYEVARYRAVMVRVGSLVASPNTANVIPAIRSLPAGGGTGFITFLGGTGVTSDASLAYGELLVGCSMSNNTNGTQRTWAGKVMRAQLEFRLAGGFTSLNCPWEFWGLP